MDDQNITTNETVIEENTMDRNQTANTTDPKKDQFARRRNQQFYNLLKTFFTICNLSGFRIEGRIRIRDLKTGRVYE